MVLTSGQEKPNGHRLIAASLSRLGVSHIYSVPGSPIHETLGQCVRAGIRVIGVRHQTAGVLAATAQNYVAGRLSAISIASPGPGVANALTGVQFAHDNCWPVVVLGGRRALSARGIGYFQDFDASPVFASLTKWSAVIAQSSDIESCLNRAFLYAQSGRPGPVYLDVTEEALLGSASSDPNVAEPAEAVPHPDPGDISRAAELLGRAKRPLLIIGKGVRWSSPLAELRALVEHARIPFVTSPMGRGVLSDDHWLCCNAFSGRMQANADFVLVVGARLDWQFRFGHQFANDAHVVVIDIDADQLRRYRRSTLALNGDVKHVLRDLLDHVKTIIETGSRAEFLSGWQNIVADGLKGVVARRARVVDRAAVMTPDEALVEIEAAIPESAVTVLDGNVTMLVAQQIIPMRKPFARLTAGSGGCVGVGIPMALGARIASGRDVVAICGDSAFGFSALELETAVRHRIPITVIVLSNQGISGSLNQRADYPEGHERISMFVSGARYERIMDAFGGFSAYVSMAKDLGPIVRQAVSSGKPACINVEIEPDWPVPPQFVF